jgi:hypothetical protein
MRNECAFDPINERDFVSDNAPLATLNLGHPQGQLLIDTVTKALLAYGRFPQSMKGKNDIIPSLVEEITTECLNADLLGKPNAELVKEAQRITRARVRKLKPEARWRDKNPKDCYCKKCRRNQDVVRRDGLTLTLECGHTRQMPKSGLGIQRSKSEWAIEQPKKVSAEDTPSGVVQGCDNQIDEETGQQFHTPLSDCGNDPFGYAIASAGRFGNGSEDALLAELDYWSQLGKILSCIGSDNFKWLVAYYERTGDGTLTPAEHQKCYRLCEKLRNSLTP